MIKNGEHNGDELLRRIAKRDEKAFYTVYDEFYNGLCHYSYKITGNRQEAEDITIQAFAKLFDRAAQLESYAHLRHWLYLAVRNASLDYLKAVHLSLKKQEEWQNLFYREADINNVIIEDEVIRRLYDAIETLPEQRRKIFKLIYIDRLKVKEVASRLGISENTVNTQKKRALIMLKRIILLLVFGYF